MYGNVPGVLNVLEKVPPGDSDPLSQAPPIAVVVWAITPLLSHCTVSPTLIVGTLGLKKKSPMDMLAVADKGLAEASSTLRAMLATASKATRKRNDL